MFIFDKEKSTLVEVEVNSENKYYPGFNAIADPHVDFYLLKNYIEISIETYVERLLSRTEILEDTLLIGGDIANSNEISLLFLEKILPYWDHILVIPGNHEWYGQDMENEDRYQDLIREVRANPKMEKIVFLKDQEEVFSHRNISYGGAMLMYNINDPETLLDFRTFMNDRNFIAEDFIKSMHKDDLAYYNKVIDQVDVFLSHVPAVYSKNHQAPKYSQLFHNADVDLKKHVLYIHGHSHMYGIASNGFEDGICALNAAIGYPQKEAKNQPYTSTIKVIK